MFPVGRLVRGLGHKNLVKACTAPTFSVRQRTLHYRSVFAFSESSYGHHDSGTKLKHLYRKTKLLIIFNVIHKALKLVVINMILHEDAILTIVCFIISWLKHFSR